MKRSRPRQVSAKRAVLNVQRRAFARRILEERYECEAAIPAKCWKQATDVHEIKTRARGGSIVDEGNVLALCRPCHSFITDHPSWATEHGFIVNSYSSEADLRAAARARHAFVHGIVLLYDDTDEEEPDYGAED